MRRLEQTTGEKQGVSVVADRILYRLADFGERAYLLSENCRAAGGERLGRVTQTTCGLARLVQCRKVVAGRAFRQLSGSSCLRHQRSVQLVTGDVHRRFSDRRACDQSLQVIQNPEVCGAVQVVDSRRMLRTVLVQGFINESPAEVGVPAQVLVGFEQGEGPNPPHLRVPRRAQHRTELLQAVPDAVGHLPIENRAEGGEHAPKPAHERAERVYPIRFIGPRPRIRRHQPLDEVGENRGDHLERDARFAERGLRSPDGERVATQCSRQLRGAGRDRRTGSQKLMLDAVKESGALLSTVGGVVKQFNLPLAPEAQDARAQVRCRDNVIGDFDHSGPIPVEHENCGPMGGHPRHLDQFLVANDGANRVDEVARRTRRRGLIARERITRCSVIQRREIQSRVPLKAALGSGPLDVPALVFTTGSAPQGDEARGQSAIRGVVVDGTEIHRMLSPQLTHR